MRHHVAGKGCVCEMGIEGRARRLGKTASPENTGRHEKDLRNL